MSTPEFYIPGTFFNEDTPEADPQDLHQAGLDQIAPAYDPITLLTGGIGFDPEDLSEPSLDTRQDIEPKELPQWGPPFVKFMVHKVSELEKLIDNSTRKWSYEPVTIFIASSMNTTATGGLDLATTPNCFLFQPVPGFTFALHRLGIFLPANASYNFAVPYTNAAGYWELRVDNEAIDGRSMVSGVGSIPTVITWGTRDAPRCRDGEVLSLYMNTGPNSTRILVKAQGTLDRTIEG